MNLITICYDKGSEAWAQVTQRGGRSLILGDIPGHVAQGSEFPDLAVGVPVHCSRVGLDDLKRCLPAQMILWFFIYPIMLCSWPWVFEMCLFQTQHWTSYLDEMRIKRAH